MTQLTFIPDPPAELVDLDEELHLAPIFRDPAFAFIEQHHRTHKCDRAGWLFGVSLRNASGAVRAVGYLSRPAAGALDDGTTAEIARCCTLGQRNACSRIYGALRRAASALGYRVVVSYTLETEHGASLKASGFVREVLTAGGEWGRKKRPRVKKTHRARCAGHGGRHDRHVWPVVRGGAVCEPRCCGVGGDRATTEGAVSRTLQAGDVIAEVDHRGSFVELWVVTATVARSGSVCPGKVRRACRSRAAVEEWDGFNWRFSEHAHNFKTPPEKR